MIAQKNLVVIGNGMVGHRFLEQAVEAGLHMQFNIITFCEEPRYAYDRVYLSSYFSGKTAEDLSLLSKPDYYQANGIHVHLGEKVVSINRAAKTVTSDKGTAISYDTLVLATGSFPFVPPIPGNDAKGCFVYRTIDESMGETQHHRRRHRRRFTRPRMCQRT